MLFGEFLIEKKIISRDKLNEALELQEAQQKSTPLGNFAVQKGWLDKNELLRVLMEQRKIRDSSSKSFADLSVKLGYLSHQQIQELEEERTRTQSLLGEVLIAMGVLEQSHLLELLREFHAHK